MPRSTKYRKVCAEFQHKVFVPEEKGRGFITLTVEELEAMRLCDFEGLDQEEAALRMEISRGTLQRILYSARHKVAEALCEGKGVRIQGGTYEVAESCCCNYRCKICKRSREKASENL